MNHFPFSQQKLEVLLSCFKISLTELPYTHKQRGAPSLPLLWFQLHTAIYLFSHFWFATVQLVLHADWHDVWHSPQPEFLRSFFNAGLLIVFICFICTLPITFCAHDLL